MKCASVRGAGRRRTGGAGSSRTRAARPLRARPRARSRRASRPVPVPPALHLAAALHQIHDLARVGGVHTVQDADLAGARVHGEPEPLRVEGHRVRGSVIRSRVVASSPAAICGCTVVLPFPNSAVPTARSKDPSGSSETRASAMWPPGGPSRSWRVPPLADQPAVRNTLRDQFGPSPAHDVDTAVEAVAPTFPARSLKDHPRGGEGARRSRWEARRAGPVRPFPRSASPRSTGPWAPRARCRAVGATRPGCRPGGRR